jgi:hypothetical protein
MQCRDVRDLADSFLSEQLLVETNHELLRHLDTCPDCRVEIAGRRAMRAKLRAAFAHAEKLRPRPDFAAELLQTLRPAQPAVAISRRSLLQSWWALAAGLVLAAGGGLFVRQSSSRSRLARLAREAAGDHQNCAVRFNLAERPIGLEDAGRRYGALVDEAREVVRLREARARLYLRYTLRSNNVRKENASADPCGTFRGGRSAPDSSPAIIDPDAVTRCDI